VNRLDLAIDDDASSAGTAVGIADGGGQHLGLDDHGDPVIDPVDQ
jgi:hypothetical protein